MSYGKKVWVVLRCDGSKKQILLNPETGEGYLNLDEVKANSLVEKYTEAFPERTYVTLPYAAGKLGRALVEND